MRHSGLTGRAAPWWCAIAATLAVACSGNGSTPASPTPSAPAPQTPCAAAAEQASEPDDIEPRSSPIRRLAKPTADRPRDPQIHVLDTLSIHRAAVARGLIRPLSIDATSEDVGDISVLQDQGDVILRPNAFDLRGTGLRFVRNASGGYDIARVDASFRSTLGDR